MSSKRKRINYGNSVPEASDSSPQVSAGELEKSVGEGVKKRTKLIMNDKQMAEYLKNKLLQSGATISEIGLNVLNGTAMPQQIKKVIKSLELNIDILGGGTNEYFNTDNIDLLEKIYEFLKTREESKEKKRIFQTEQIKAINQYKLSTGLNTVDLPKPTNNNLYNTEPIIQGGQYTFFYLVSDTIFVRYKHPHAYLDGETKGKIENTRYLVTKIPSVDFINVCEEINKKVKELNKTLRFVDYENVFFRMCDELTKDKTDSEFLRKDVSSNFELKGQILRSCSVKYYEFIKRTKEIKIIPVFIMYKHRAPYFETINKITKLYPIGKPSILSVYFDTKTQSIYVEIDKEGYPTPNETDDVILLLIYNYFVIQHNKLHKILSFDNYAWAGMRNNNYEVSDNQTKITKLVSNLIIDIKNLPQIKPYRQPNYGGAMNTKLLKGSKTKKNKLNKVNKTKKNKKNTKSKNKYSKSKTTKNKKMKKSGNRNKSKKNVRNKFNKFNKLNKVNKTKKNKKCN